jgi:hypothetical protein
MGDIGSKFYTVRFKDQVRIQPYFYLFLNKNLIRNLIFCEKVFGL